MKIIEEFKTFLGSGSAIDLAVGVLVASALGSILKSLVDELVVPFTGLLGKSDWSNAYLILKGENSPAYQAVLAVAKDGIVPLAEARKAGVVALGYGQFATVLINTLVLAFAVFVVVRIINKLKAAAAPAKESLPVAEAEPVLDAQIVLLTEIRDVLCKGK